MPYFLLFQSTSLPEENSAILRTLLYKTRMMPEGPFFFKLKDFIITKSKIFKNYFMTIKFNLINDLLVHHLIFFWVLLFLSLFCIKW